MIIEPKFLGPGRIWELLEKFSYLRLALKISLVQSLPQFSPITLHLTPLEVVDPQSCRYVHTPTYVVDVDIADLLKSRHTAIIF